MRFDPDHPGKNVVQRAAQVIAAGGIVLHPTDTIHGLACDPFNRSALERILVIKGRSNRKGFLVLIPNVGWVDRFADGVPELFWQTAQQFWPGPVTLLGNARADLSPLLVGERNTIGLRQPHGVFLEQWMAAIPGPIVSTSASLSGEPLPSSLDELRKLFESKVDYFLEGGAVDPSRPPSTVVDFSQPSTRLLRRGQMGTEVALFLGISEEATA